MAANLSLMPVYQVVQSGAVKTLTSDNAHNVHVLGEVLESLLDELVVYCMPFVSLPAEAQANLVAQVLPVEP